MATPTTNAPPPTAHAVTPGPNAFAVRAAEADAHHLRGNAFYQQATVVENMRLQDQDMAGRLSLTPPTVVHPALRDDFRLGDSSPTSNLMANLMAIATAKSNQSPPLKLMPGEGFQGNPTDRGLESFHEELEPEESGDETEYPVFKFTPKLGTSEFSKSVGPATPTKKKGSVFNWSKSQEQPATSPKKRLLEKRLLEKMKLNNTRTQSPTVARGESGGELLPPKAKAVLSTPPKKPTILGRSPSKKLGMFARKVADAVSSSETPKTRLSLGNESRAASTGTSKPNFSASVGYKTPAREQRPKVPRFASQPQRVSRSQRYGDRPVDPADVVDVLRSSSLQYADGEIPPTPPAKDTPPDEKTKKAQETSDRIMQDHKESCEKRAEFIKKMSQRSQAIAATSKREMRQKPESKLTSPLRHKNFADDTPTRETYKLIGEDCRTSPTKYGGYARTNLPTITKAPSFQSMHGDLHQEHSLEDIKKCADAYGLDGLRDNPESFYKGDPKVVHSPSLYEEDWSTKGNISTQASADTLHTTGMFRPSPSMPDVLEHVRQMPSPAVSASATQTHQQPLKLPAPSKESPFLKARSSSRSSSKGTIPVMYSGLPLDPSSMDLLAGLNVHHGPSPGMATYFTRTDEGDRNYDSLADESDESVLDSPQPSPQAYSHPSAEPSPLEYLRPDVYSPPEVLSTPPKAESPPLEYLRPDVYVPEVVSTPRRGKTNKAPSASPSPPKTLTPSRSRGRIEDYKSNGSPIARAANSSPAKSQTLQLPSPLLKTTKPTFKLTPPTASPATFLREPEKKKLIYYRAERPLVPLWVSQIPLSSTQHAPQEFDSDESSPVRGASSLPPSGKNSTYAARLAKLRQARNDPDSNFALPIKREQKQVSTPSRSNEVTKDLTNKKTRTPRTTSPPPKKASSPCAASWPPPRPRTRPSKPSWPSTSSSRPLRPAPRPTSTPSAPTWLPVATPSSSAARPAPCAPWA
jgi:hypothetical protein